MLRAFPWSLAVAVAVAPATGAAQAPPRIAFGDTVALASRGMLPGDLVRTPFTAEERAELTPVIGEVVAEARDLLDGMPDSLRVTVLKVSRDLAVVGGVTGRADAPGEILVEISTVHDGGLAAQRPALRQTLLHESHHLVRGWTMQGNRWGPGIGIAAVNEGLAEVFAEEQTGRVLPANEYPDEVGDWAEEILALPVDADYTAWMFDHPDGRLAVGYRTGRYLVHQAMARSGMTVLELSELPPERIVELAGMRLATPDQTRLDGPDAEGVRDREIAFARTMADRDFAAFQTFIDPDAVFFDGHRPIRGREAVAKAWRGYFEGPEAPFSWTPDLVQVLESGGLAWSSGPVTAEGREVGRFNSVWRRGDDGVWRVVFDKGS